MDNERKFQKHTVVVTILTDDPNFNVDHVVNHNAEGAIVDADHKESKDLTGKEMADECYKARSTPGYFFLDDDGNPED